jgi:hypothetical protein
MLLNVSKEVALNRQIIKCWYIQIGILSREQAVYISAVPEMVK